MKVLVTGAGGFIGKPVSKCLSQVGHNVYCLRTSKDLLKSDNHLSMITADLLSPIEVTQLMNRHKFDGLVHLAWETTPKSYWESNENLKWVSASLHLLEMFRRNGGQRVIIAGSSAEYQWGEDLILDEYKSPKIPSSLYGVSKNALYSIIEKWATVNQVSWAWAHLFNVFGPFENKQRLIPKIISQLHSGVSIDFDDGLLYRDFLHVDDVGHAFTALLDSSVSGAVNIASGQSITIREVVTILGEITGRSNLLNFGSLNNFSGPESVVAAVTRLKNEIGWSAQRSIHDRLTSTCKWWENNNDQ